MPPLWDRWDRKGRRPPRDGAAQRREMIDEQLLPRGIRDERVLAAMAAVPRECFVPAAWRDRAYDDSPLPIGAEQTISQPYIVALMLEWAQLSPSDRVLEIGCGSGYVLALLDHMGIDAYGIEIVQELADRAAENLAAAARDLREHAGAIEPPRAAGAGPHLRAGAPGPHLRAGAPGPHLRAGDGWAGWPEAAPFAAILISAATPLVPPLLVEQIAEGGRLILPLGRHSQELVRVRREGGRVRREPILPVRFVPLLGEVERVAPEEEGGGPWPGGFG